MKVVITGGSGFLGVSLARTLSARGDEVSIVSRTPPSAKGTWTHATWDGQSVGDWKAELDGADAIVNLAGRSVDCIKTADHRDEILRSRVQTTSVIGEALRQIDSPPPVWVQMSTAHIYGDPPDAVCSEGSPYGYGLAPFVAQAWEAAFDAAILPEMRGVVLRTGFVLGRGGGALSKLWTLARIGLGGTVGHGRQGMSWIHEADMNAIFVRGIENETMSGVYIATAPSPVGNAEFMRTLRRAVGMPIGLPAMEWMVRIGAPLIMKTDPELALYGRYCVPTRLLAEGFDFSFNDLEAALTDLTRAA